MGIYLVQPLTEICLTPILLKLQETGFESIQI